MNIISPSQAAAWTCNQRWLFAYGLGLGAPREVSDQMSLGLVVHRLMENTDIEPGFLEDPVVWEHARDIMTRYKTHWETRPKLLNIIQREVEIIEPIPPRSGVLSYLSPKWGGRLDGIAMSVSSQALWVLEIKTTSQDLDHWTAAHASDPQGAIYCYLLSRSSGKATLGVVYDLVRSTPCHKIEDITVKKPRAGTLPQTTSERWAKASGLEADWHKEVFQALDAREKAGYWFKRHAVRFTLAELERVAGEMRATGFILKKHHSNLNNVRWEVHHTADPMQRGRFISRYLDENGATFPRNWTQCWLYNKPCPYMAACQTWEPGALAELVPNRPEGFRKKEEDA